MAQATILSDLAQSDTMDNIQQPLLRCVVGCHCRMRCSKCRNVGMCSNTPVVGMTLCIECRTMLENNHTNVRRGLTQPRQGTMKQ
jgi:hypothetical protein